MQVRNFFSQISKLVKNEDRSSRYKKNTLILIFCQLSNIIISLLLVRLCLGVLGTQEYAIWITVVGIVEWFNFLDIGLGHGLRNKYAETKAKGQFEELKGYVSSTFYILLIVSGLLFVVFYCASHFINWASILNASKQLNSAIHVLIVTLVAIFCLRFVFNIINILLTADQKPAIPALIAASGNLLSLILVFIAIHLKYATLVSLGIIISFSQFVPILGAFVIFFSKKYRDIFPRLSYFKKTYLKGVMNLGLQFFLIQLTALLTLQSNNLIISQVAGLEEVTNYNIAFKYLSVIFTFYMTLLTPLWSATTEAYARRDMEWIRNSIKKLNKIWFALIFVGITMILASSLVYKIWLNKVVTPDFLLLSLILLYFLLLIKSNLYRTVMNGVGKIRLQFFITSIQAVLHIPLAVFLGNAFGVYGVVAVMTLWVLINCIWEPIQYAKILSNTGTGIWNK